MIAWTGMEMYENGWESDLRCRALRKVGNLTFCFPLHTLVRVLRHFYSPNISSDQSSSKQVER